MRILVTGGAGFIGSHTCVALLAKGYEIILLDSFVNSSEKSLKRVIEITKIEGKNNSPNIEIYKGDIRDEKILEKIFSDSEISNKPIEAVLHFAGLKSVAESVINPFLYWDINVNGTIKLLLVMDRYKCRTIIFSSSATIYGLSNDQPILENSKIKPTNPYGQTKSTIEQLLNDVYKSNPERWRVANLRYFNPLGSHPSGLIGEAPLDVPNNIFPYLIQVAAGDIEVLTIFGNDWPTKDGTGVRDYIHVMDVADGHLAALEKLLKSDPQIINFNLGTGVGTSVLDLIKTFESVTDVNVPYVFSSRRKGDVPTVIADNSLAISSLNWAPKKSIEQMCTDGWKWKLLNPKGYL